MSTVLEEKIPRIQNELFEQFGRMCESAVDSVTQGIKAAVSMGIAQDKNGYFEIPNFGYPQKASGELGPLIGTSISETAGIGSPDALFQGQFKGNEKMQNAELTAFTELVFGTSGLMKSQEKGIIINGAQKGVVGPEYTPVDDDQRRVQEMMETVKKTLLLQQDLQKMFTRVVKA
jgi:hypothetical protein